MRHQVRICYFPERFTPKLIERSDFTIFLIALHTALSVLRPGKSSGLRSYRYRAYACWASFAILLPALAFINEGKDEAYISQGTYCFLPLRPIWYRLVFSWIPRYLILCTIAAIYVTIYIHTVMQFGKFDIQLTSSTVSSARRASEGADERPAGRHRISPLSSWFGRSKKEAQATTEEHRPAMNDNDNPAPVLSGSSNQSRSDPSPARIYRRPTLVEALRDKNLLPFGRRGLPIDANPTLRKRHAAIKRQLRYMFIYPLVYLLMWIAPFINHCYFYTKKHNPPFVLNCIALTCLCLQCAVDCLIFSVRERPWRSATNGHGASRSRQSSAGGGSAIGMVELADRNGRTDIPNPTSETSPAIRFSQEAGRQPQQRNWWDNEPM